MTFTLPAYIRDLPSDLATAERIAATADDCTYRANDFNGLSAHDKLIRKLDIMSLRGTYDLNG